MTKTKVVKAKVSVNKKKKRMTKGVENPWEVWDVFNGYHSPNDGFSTKAKAEKAIKSNEGYWVAPVIVHIDIPPMEY